MVESFGIGNTRLFNLNLVSWIESPLSSRFANLFTFILHFFNTMDRK